MNTQKLYITCVLKDSIEFEYQGENITLALDCFKTVITEENENNYLDVDFTDGFTQEVLTAILDDKRYQYSKGQLASKGTWKDIKSAWLIEVENDEKN